MNRTDRLLAIVLELQGRGRARAEDLAATFETSKRTIYRDIQALGQAGVPIVSIPGRGYSLIEGYFLPPLSFSAEEAAMLLLGGGVVMQQLDEKHRVAAQAASRKIAGILPESVRTEVHALQRAIHFVTSRTAQEETLRDLHHAILARHVVHFRYHSRQSEDGNATDTERDADPHTLIYTGDVWYLTAYCHLRHDIRNFRLDRIEDLRTLPETFPAPETISGQPETRTDTRTIVARALFAPEVARWVRESPSFFATDLEETPEGLLMTLRLRQERDALQWMLGWGRAVRVLEPESLRALVAAEAEALWRQHT
jgi:predicted DNA-binding transcriptional regulator YafY